MALVNVKELIEAGVHFGHRVSRWHPKMRPYIFGKRNLIHIIDVRETVKGLVRAANFLTKLAAMGKEVIYVGTKRQAKALIQREAQRAGMHWVCERWLGGTLTNFDTIRSRLKRLDELEALEREGTIEQYSKKRISALRRERRKILRNLEGLRNLKELPGALIVVDVNHENIAVKEARKMGIPVIGLVDTDSDPREVDIVIPGNDDAYRSIQLILRVLTDAIIAGREKYSALQAEQAKAEETGEPLEAPEKPAPAATAAPPAEAPSAPSTPAAAQAGGGGAEARKGDGAGGEARPGEKAEAGSETPRPPQAPKDSSPSSLDRTTAAS